MQFRESLSCTLSTAAVGACQASCPWGSVGYFSLGQFFLALLLTAHGTVNDTTVSAGFGSDIVSGLNRLVSKITNRNNVTANITAANVTSTNSTALPPDITCPISPARPQRQNRYFQHPNTAVT
jgi:hypothetical protein